jgi:hypothetical protein
MNDFWEPETMTSIFHSSIGQGIAPVPEMPSTTRMASVLATTSPNPWMSKMAPVEVSDSWQRTALTPGSALSSASSSAFV